MQDHGSGQKSWYTANITVFMAITKSVFSYSPRYHVEQVWPQHYVELVKQTYVKT